MPHLVHALMRRTTPLLSNVRQRIHSVRDGVSWLQQQQQHPANQSSNRDNSTTPPTASTTNPNTTTSTTAIVELSKEALVSMQEAMHTAENAQEQSTLAINGVAQNEREILRFNRELNRSIQELTRVSLDTARANQETVRISKELESARQDVVMVRRDVQQVTLVATEATRRAEHAEQRVVALEQHVRRIHETLDTLQEKTIAWNDHHDQVLHQLRERVLLHETTAAEQLHTHETNVQTLTRNQQHTNQTIGELTLQQTQLDSVCKHQISTQFVQAGMHHQQLQSELQHMREYVARLASSLTDHMTKVSFSVTPSSATAAVGTRATTETAAAVVAAVTTGGTTAVARHPTISAPSREEKDNVAVILPIEDTNAAAQIEAMLSEPLSSPIFVLAASASSAAASVAAAAAAAPAGALITSMPQETTTITMDCQESAGHIRSNVSKKVAWTSIALPDALSRLAAVDSDGLETESHAFVLRVTATKRLTPDSSLTTTMRPSGKRRPTSLSSSVINTSMLMPATEDSLLDNDGGSLLDESMLVTNSAAAGVRAASLSTPMDPVERAEMADRAEQPSEQLVRVLVQNGRAYFVLDAVNHAQGVQLDDNDQRVATTDSSYELRVGLVTSNDAHHLKVDIRRNIRRMPIDRLHAGVWRWVVLVERLSSE